MTVGTANGPADVARGTVAAELYGGASVAADATGGAVEDAMKKRKKRHSGGPQPKLRVKLNGTAMSDRSVEGDGVDGGV
jgi:hypothetical protein